MNLIDEGKVMNIGCMQGGCSDQFSEEDVQANINSKVFEKYQRFVRNAMVDLDPDLRWCPEPKCNGYVRKNKKLKSREVTCETCKARVCFDCGEKAHKGECGMSQKD